MRMIDLVVAGITLGLLWGSWQFIFLFMSKRSYNKLKYENERFLDFCLRSYDSFIWRFRKVLHIDWFYNSKAFQIYLTLRGVVLVLIAVALCIMLFMLYKTEYWNLLFERI